LGFQAFCPKLATLANDVSPPGLQPAPAGTKPPAGRNPFPRPRARPCILPVAPRDRSEKIPRGVEFAAKYFAAPRHLLVRAHATEVPVPRGPAGGLLVFLRRLPPAPDSDADLLDRFVRARDGAAFAALLA